MATTKLCHLLVGTLDGGKGNEGGFSWRQVTAFSCLCRLVGTVLSLMSSNTHLTTPMLHVAPNELR
jgi:hypothetical protein